MFINEPVKDNTIHSDISYKKEKKKPTKFPLYFGQHCIRGWKIDIVAYINTMKAISFLIHNKLFKINMVVKSSCLLKMLLFDYF